MNPSHIDPLKVNALVSALIERGYGTCRIPWNATHPADVFSRFDALQESAATPEGLATYLQVDRALVARAGDTPLLSTSPVARMYYAADGLTGFGHTYYPGTLDAVREVCPVPPALEALWEALESIISVVDPLLRKELSSLHGIDDFPSGVRIWKYIKNELAWATPPHYDLTVVSAILATANSCEELLTIGLEANGAPIRLVRERVGNLRRFSPELIESCIVLPGIYSNRWGLEPTWHYVKALSLQDERRHSLVWSIVHPPHLPVRPTRHVQDEVAPNEVTWT